MTRRSGLSLLGAVALVGVLLALPAPKRGVVAVRAGLAPAGSAAVPGPTLAQVWPRAHTFGFPAILEDGSAFNPLAIVDGDLALGAVTDAASTRYGLAVVTGAGAVRVLETHAAADAPAVDAIAATATEFFWMDTVSDAAGNSRTSLWRAARGGGKAGLLTADVGKALFANSRYDLQVVDGRIYWVAAPRGSGHRTELRSVALSGGRVSVRPLAGDFVMTAWPWLTSSPGASGSRVDLDNLLTGAHHAVPAPANQQLTCTPAWCRMLAANVQDASEIDVVRPDGTDRRRVGDVNSSAIADDVALRDRFEVLATPTPTSSPTIVIEVLRLYDIVRRRAVVLTPAASNAGARGDYVWWATGDNETLAWHGLDLRSLT
ncbi:MAG: hypothetical protein V7603_6792 [Micromonosporaceae bacterium]